MESFGCPVGIYSLMPQNLFNLLQLIPPRPPHIQIWASQTKEGEARGRAVPLNSLVYLQRVLIFCCPPGRRLVFTERGPLGQAVFLLCQSVDGPQVMPGFA